MRGPGLIGEVFDVVGRLGSGAQQSAPWLATLASCLAVLAVGGLAARVARRLGRNSTPELIVLLDRSAAFYGRWPEHLLAGAPAAEIAAEEARCRRIIELLESESAVGRPERAGVIDGLRAWITLLGNVIEGPVPTPLRA